MRSQARLSEGQQITETAQQMGEAASQYYAQGRQQLEGVVYL